MSIAQLRVRWGDVRRNTAEIRTIRVLIALGAFACASCTLMVDSNKTQCHEHSDCADLFGADTDLVCIHNVCALPTCSVDDDCSHFGGKYEGNVCVEGSCKPPVTTEPLEWACLDTAPVPPAATRPLEVKAHFQHMVSQSPMKNVVVRVCRKLDVDCENPETMTMTDINGDITVAVPPAFSGYLAADREGLMPARYYFSPAVNEDLTVASIQLVEGQLAKTLVMNTTGTSQSDDRGLVLLSALDCMAVGAVGISFASPDADDSVTTFYAVMSLPSKTATETATGGFGGFLNAPLGNFKIDGARVSDGRKIGEVSVLVRPGELAITRLVATYQPTGP